MSFTSWLENLTAELRNNPEVQERAYFRKDKPVPQPATSVPIRAAQIYDESLHKGVPEYVPGASEDFKDWATWGPSPDSDERNSWVVACRVCDRALDFGEFGIDPADFIHDECICGGSPQCCP